MNDAVELYTTSNLGFRRNEVFRQRLSSSGIWAGLAVARRARDVEHLGRIEAARASSCSSRGYDGALWYRRTTGGRAWQSLGGQLASDPSAVGDGSSIWVFARFGGRQINFRRFDGGAGRRGGRSAAA